MGIRISEMEEATTFGADDYVPIVTSGTNKKALGAKIKDFIAGFFATKTGDNISDKATFRSAIEISATNTPFDNTGTGMSAENVQAGIMELSRNRALIDGSNIASPATFRQNIGAINLVVLSALIEVSFQDTATIGYRTTEATKVAVSSLSGYPTGRTIVGMIAQATYLYGGEAFVDDSGYIRACTKASTSSLPVKVLCFYL